MRRSKCNTLMHLPCALAARELKTDPSRVWVLYPEDEPVLRRDRDLDWANKRLPRMLDYKHKTAGNAGVAHNREFRHLHLRVTESRHGGGDNDKHVRVVPI